MDPLPLNRVYLAHALSEPSFGATPETLFYVRLADGRRSIFRQEAASGLAQVITTEPLPAGGIGYGGGVYTVRDQLLVYAAKGGRLHGLDLNTGAQWPTSPVFEGVAAPAIAPGGRFVAFLAEQDGRANVLLADVAGEQFPLRASANPWYAFNPTFSPDGTRLAWMEWNEFDMPWDEARLVVACLARPAGDAQRVAELLPLEISTLARPRVSFSSPQFSPDGKYLAYVSDETGWRSLWVTEAGAGDLGATARCIETGPGEIGGPDWVPGQFKMRWSDDGRALYAIRRHESRAHLLRVDWPAGTVTEIETGWPFLSDLNIRGRHLIFFGSSPTEPVTLVTFDLDAGQQQRRATAGVGLLDPNALVQPRVLSWKTVGEATAWGIFYPAATDPNHATGPRPLLVYIHGGPTSERLLTWEAEAQYFATRGWHYLIVNHRGGTGFGRAYQDLLNGRWGVVDVEDARTGAQHLVDAGLADPQRLVITGRSAGGYTTLMALARDPEFWAAGVATAAVTDMYELRRGSHRFEVNYEMGLIGRLPEAGPLWKERSPLTHVANVRAPVQLFHGRDDRAVPVQQSIDYAEALRRNGRVVDLVLYDGEGHSFNRETTLRDQYQRIEQFLDKYVICLQK